MNTYIHKIYIDGGLIAFPFFPVQEPSPPSLVAGVLLSVSIYESVDTYSLLVIYVSMDLDHT